MRLYRNLSSLRIYNSYTQNLAAQSKGFNTISSGLKVQTYKDNPTAKAKSEKLSIEIKSLQMANRNIQDSVSLLQTADGGMENISDSLQRIRELTVQAGGTAVDDDRQAIQDEINQLLEHVTYVAENTELNGVKLLGSNNNGESIDLLVGLSSQDKATVPTFNLTAESLGLVNDDGTNKVGIEDIGGSLERLDSAIESLTSARGTYGAICNKMESLYTAGDEIVDTVTTAESEISGADIANEMVEYTKNSILVQSGIAMMAQSNQFPQDILQILASIKSR